MHGSLASHLAAKIDASRGPFKALRDAENALAPRRNIRTGLTNQITRIEYDQRKDQLPKLPELKRQLQQAEAEDQDAEIEIEIMKRKAIRESEQMKWEAIREVSSRLIFRSCAMSLTFVGSTRRSSPWSRKLRSLSSP